MTTEPEERNRAFADRFALHLDDVRFQRDPLLYGFGLRETGMTVAASGFRLPGIFAGFKARLLRCLRLQARMAHNRT